MITVKHSRATAPQRQFWSDPSPLRAFVGGVGSGKTRAGCVEILRQPPGSTGMVLAPHYKMLRDATLRTFLDLTRRAGILESFHRTEFRAVLRGNRTVLFRSADDPDSLRGPNLGWFYLDEAALMKHMVFLIMLGRLREDPGKGWVTTTPLGKNHWIYNEFATGKPDRALIKASTRTNTFLPADFVETLLSSYDAEFAKQEIDGDWLDSAFGQLIPESWLDIAATIERPPGDAGPRYLGCDPSGGTGRDRSAIVVLDRHGILHLEASNVVNIPHTAQKISELSRRYDIQHHHVIYDKSPGGGGDELPRHLENYGIRSAVPYSGSGSKDERFANRRSQMGHKLKQLLDRQRPLPSPYVVDTRPPSAFNLPLPSPPQEIQPPFCLPPTAMGENGELWPKLKAELLALRYVERSGKWQLEPKEAMKERMGGKSPDLTDSIFHAIYLIPPDQAPTRW